jgi:hypothetical protein
LVLSSEGLARPRWDRTRYAGLQARTRRLGLQCAMHRTWRQTAQQTLEVYYEVVEQCQAVTAGVVSTPISPA